MANTDRPNGFTPVKTLSGAPVSQMVRTIGVADADNLYIGDIFNLESGLADVGATADTALLGVVVGFGMVDAAGVPISSYNPSDLTEGYYNDSGKTHTSWVVYYVPVDDVVFEAQTATALDLAVGATCDLVDATGGSSTGRSTQEITTSSNGEFTVVEHPKILDYTAGTYNDRTAAAGRYYVVVTRAAQALHA